MSNGTLNIQQKSTYATISWSVPGRFWEYYTYVISFRLDNDTDWMTHVVNPIDDPSYYIMDLKHGSLYTVKVLPYRTFNDSIEAGTPSQEFTFGTPIGEYVKPTAG